MIRQWRKTALAGGMLLVAVTLTSCLRVDMDIELDGETASGEMVLAVSQEVLDMTGGDASDVFDDSNVPEGATVEPYDEDGFVGQRVTFEDTAITEFDDPESVTITYDEDAGRYEVGGVMDFTTEGEGLGDIPPSMVDSFDVSIAVTFPGEVVEHNGELEGTTVTWSPQFGEVTEFQAVAEDSGGAAGGLTWLWVSLAVIAALLVIGALVFLSRRRGDAEAHDGTVDGTADGTAAASHDAGAAPDAAASDAKAGDTRDLSGDVPQSDRESTDGSERGPDDQR